MPRGRSQPTEFVWPPPEDQALMIVRLDDPEAILIPEAPPPSPASSRRQERLPLTRPVTTSPRPSRVPRLWLVAAGAAALVAGEWLTPPPVPPRTGERVDTALAAGLAVEPPTPLETIATGRPAPPATVSQPPAPLGQSSRRALRPARRAAATPPRAMARRAPTVGRRAQPSAPPAVPPRFTDTVQVPAPVIPPLAAVRREPVPIDERLPAIPSPFPLPRGTRATVLVTIDEEGRVVEAQLAGDPGAFGAPILAAARQWRYRPARVDGRPARATRQVDVVLR